MNPVIEVFLIVDVLKRVALVVVKHEVDVC